MKTKTEPSESNYRIRVTRLSVLPVGEPIFSEQCTDVSIVDEAAGEFVEVSQHSNDTKSQTILIDPREWSAIKQAVDQLISECEP
jgi:hypothetical protein